jgi:hypothetical protein
MHGLKYILKIKIQIKIFVIDSGSTSVCATTGYCRVLFMNDPVIVRSLPIA